MERSSLPAMPQRLYTGRRESIAHAAGCASNRQAPIPIFGEIPMTSAKTGPQRSAVVSMMMAFGLLVAISWTARAASPLLLVVSKGDNALVVVDPDSGKILGKATAGEGPHEVEASADGKRAFVSNYGAKAPGSSLSVIDLATMQEVHRVEIGPGAMPHGLLMAGGKLYFTAQGFKLIGRYDPPSEKIDWLMGTGQNRTHMVVAT